MTPSEILRWINTYGEAIPDEYGRRSFRVSAWLQDGTYLPCVLLREADTRARAAMELLGRTEAEDFDEMYPGLVRSLATGGSRVEALLSTSLEQSPFAMPWALLSQLRDELEESPIEFVATMDDGATFAFGTADEVAFFDMPPGYTGARVRSLTRRAHAGTRVYRERACFVAFVDDIDFGPMPVL